MASLFARVFRSISMIMVLVAVTLSHPVQAAPFAAIVMDARSGETLYSKNADARLHPASLTKMMTLYIVFQEIEAGRLSLDTKVTVSKHAAAQPPSRLGLKPGQKIALRYLIRAAAVKSANDAATAIGEHIGGSEAAFAKRMTKTAKALGMKNSTFRNANGLTADGHLSTARDMSILGRHLFYDFPQYYNIFSRRTIDAGVATVANTNSRFLDAYEGADGIKTGYTGAAGFNLTASAKRGNKRIIATVFGASSTAARNAKMGELMDMGFGIAKKNVREKKPDAAPVPDDALIAEAAPAPVTVAEVQGGSAKTIRVNGLVTRSLRPKARPGTEPVLLAETAPEEEEVPDAVAMAIAEGVESALAEATAPPPPEGTLEFQALAVAEAAAAPPVADAAATEDAVATALAEVPAEVLPEVAAATDPVAPEGTLEAQALAIANGTAAPVAPMAAPAIAPEDIALASIRPRARPDTAPQEEPVVVADAAPVAAPPVPETAIEIAEPILTPVEPILAPVVPEPEIVVAEAGSEEEAEGLGQLTAVESAFAPTDTIDSKVATAAPEAPMAPIFEPVETAEAEVATEAELIVVSKSTAGGRHWGVNVGAFDSRGEAERALLKTGLAESATLTEGLRKISQKGGKFRANFLGLTEDQADLACRRLRARGMACETLSPA